MPNAILPGIDKWSDVEAPNPGDDVRAGAAITLGTVRLGFEAVADRSLGLHKTLLAEPLIPRVILSSAGGPSATIKSPGRVAFIDALGNRRFGQFDPLVIDYDFGVGTLVPAAANWPANSWIYVYGFPGIAAGSFGIESSLVAPTDDLLTKTGDITRRYLGCFRTDGSAPPKIRAFRATRGRYVYHDLPGQVLVGGAAAAWTVVPCATLVPPHSRLALLGVQLGAGERTLYLRPGNTAITPAVAKRLFVDAGGTKLQDHLELPLDASQQLEYQVTGGGAGLATIDVEGFCE